MTWLWALTELIALPVIPLTLALLGLFLHPIMAVLIN